MSCFTSGASIINPRTFGNAMLNIIKSEKSTTAPRIDAEPIIIKIKNMK